MRWSQIKTAMALRYTSRQYKAVQVHNIGGPNVLTLNRNVQAAPLSSGEVRVSTRKIGVNYHDTYTRTGLYPLSFPFTVGCEASGVVTEIGEGVEGVSVDDRVAFFHYNSGYATEAVVPQEACFVLPNDVSYDLGAASLVQGLTAHYLAHDSFELGPAHTCVVHAAGGGTGNLLVQMAKLRGATVLATSSPGKKSDAAREAGADHIITYDTSNGADSNGSDNYDFVTAVQRICPGGCDVVYDSIGRMTSESSLLCLRPRGTCVLYGNSSGPPRPISPTLALAAASLYVHRPVLQHFLLTEAERKKRSSDLFGWIQSGELNVRISKTFALQDAADAHTFLESRQALGKVLLDPCTL